MEIHLSGDQSIEAGPSRTGVGHSQPVPAAEMLPIMEGARARGVADAFDLMGQGAILLDAAGGVLHVTAAAQALLGEQVCVQSGHLVARTADANHAIQQLLEAILDRGCKRESVELAAQDGFRALRISGLAFAPGSRSAYQLLAAVLMISDSAPDPAGFAPGGPESLG